MDEMENGLLKSLPYIIEWVIKYATAFKYWYSKDFVTIKKSVENILNVQSISITKKLNRCLVQSYI